jgi:superfamily II RNA helicase
MESLVRIVKETDSLPEPPATPALRNGYTPDRFQAFAIEAIERGENVLVTAKTGSGKTFVGEYQIAKSLQRGGRVFYTTPVKSLSNQKFHDLKKLFPEASVGIMTGDIKFCPNAQILVMTTEILRNLLFKQGTMTEKVGATSLLSLDGLDAVIFDEVHYINDPDRGHVWEETLILLPSHIKLILLSATLSKPHRFAKWLADSKQTMIWVISTMWRAVPLHHCVVNQEGKLETIFDPKEVFHTEVYRNWLAAREGKQFAADKFKEKVKDARRGGHEGKVDGKVKVISFEHQLNELLNDLSLKSNLPCIVFQFSRKGCEKLARQVKDGFLDGEQIASVKHIWDFHLARFKHSLEKSPQYHTLLELVQRGIAFHHSGLQPFLKEILEILFNKGLIKVLFATETFAVGINMPTKTVIFTALEKYTDGAMRVLKTAEYIQMAGRAGRRGKDEKGIVIYLPQRQPLETFDVRQMLTGQTQTFCSRINFHYDFVLKVLNKEVRVDQVNEESVVEKSNPKKGMKQLIEGSYWWNLEQEQKADLEKELQGIRSQIATISLTREQEDAFRQREDIENRIATCQNAKKKAAQRELERWKEDNSGPAWTFAESRYTKKKDLYEQESCLVEKHSNLLDDANDIPIVHRRISVLSELGFVNLCDDEPVLNQKGLLASEVNEGHPFLLTNLFLRLIKQKPDLQTLLTILAVFLGEAKDDNEHNKHIDDLEVSKEVYDALVTLGEDAKVGCKVEQKNGIDDPKFWDLSTEWVEPVQSWLSGDATIGSIAQKYEVFEGNVQKAMMKLAGLVEECQALATLTGSVDLLQELEKARELILRDIVIAESLYLRI